MPKITYQEIRPGKWFKLVDGQVVAAATPSEVASWRRDNPAPPNIWQDVLKTARPVARPKGQSGLAPQQGSRQDSFWKDIVKPNKTPPRGEPRVAPAEDRLHGLRPRGKEDIDVAEQASIWRDVLNQSKKKAPPAPPPVTVPPVKAREPEKPAPTKTREPEKAAAAKAAPAEKPAPARATITQKPTASPSATRPAAASAPVKAKTPAKTKARPATTEKETKSAAAMVKPASSKKPAVAVKNPPATKPSPSEKPSRAQAHSEMAEHAVPSRRKPKEKAALESSSPLYLWMVAGQSDDLLATVRAGLTRYQQRFDRAAEVVLCHSEDLPTLEGKLSVDLREGKSLPRRNVWIGLK